ncbi:hypothetical protein M409DRAFT_21039 [Zasmidium cellare ATCC 36951]|uniref:Uncharacterized protein n=1 Tax=Zasmidium cellare ATCC 36951 TaxID=1080233 RepID=A0A6A6CS67_ZASCE|nr:uncharacterized protein M409DRAFT_21039 [Zasmidium cellare ATCC 36951]KAF2169028.1 hypothetical protein M409DRAFT_21039 [Zasmidium cellare ATCC 36951]
MHWLNVPSNDLTEEPAEGEEAQSFLTINIFIFHEGGTLLLHNAQENTWVLPHEASLPNSTPETLSSLYQQTDPEPDPTSSGKSLQDIAMQSLEHGFRDFVLDNLQFHDLAFSNVLTIPSTTTQNQNLLLTTSIARLLPHNFKCNPEGLFTLNPLSPNQYDDIRLCSPQETIDLLPAEQGRLAEQAMRRYLLASKKAVVLRPSGIGPQAWMENVLATYIHCQSLHRGQKYFDRLPEELRRHPVELVMRDYKTAICRKVLRGGEVQLVVYPMTRVGFEYFMRAVGIWGMRLVGTYAWRDGAMRFEWRERVKGEWVTEYGRLRVAWIN